MHCPAPCAALTVCLPAVCMCGGPVLHLPAPVREALRSRLGVRSTAVSDAHTLDTIRAVHHASRGAHLIDTHTAVGVAGAVRSIAEDGAGLASVRHVVCMGCAHPAKFLGAVSLALRKPEAQVREDMRAEAAAHSCVAAVRDIGAGPDLVSATGLPHGCCEVLLRGEQGPRWEAKTRSVIERAWQGTPRPQAHGSKL